eukprot:scaffold3659_cov74-Skeletonema_dohrnii-CCMP3373.AAC.3
MGFEYRSQPPSEVRMLKEMSVSKSPPDLVPYHPPSHFTKMRSEIERTKVVPPTKAKVPPLFIPPHY